MNRKEFIDKWFNDYSYSYTPDIEGFTNSLTELLAEEQEIHYRKGYETAWSEAVSANKGNE